MATRAAATTTQDSGSHMNERNHRKTHQAGAREGDKGQAHLKVGVLVLALQRVEAENFETAVGLVAVKTVPIALKQLGDVVDDNGPKIELPLAVEVLGFVV